MNIQNFGSTWLKPPGIPKTLHQMREEKREQEEHQEAMRREQLAQELADAEAGGMPEEGMMDDVQLEGSDDSFEKLIREASEHFAGKRRDWGGCSYDINEVQCERNKDVVQENVTQGLESIEGFDDINDNDY